MRVAAGVALVLVLGLVVAADRVSEHVAEGLLADQVSRELGVRPDVEIGGVPFLTQALTGHYRDLRLTAPRVDGSGVRLDDVEVRLSGADVPLSSVVRGSVDAVPVDRLRVQGVVPYDELEAAAGRDVQLSAAPGGVRVSGTIRVLGQSVPASATSTVSLDGDRLVLTARELQAAGATARLSGALDLSLAVPELPYGVRLTSVAAGPDGVTVSGQATDTVLRR